MKSRNVQHNNGYIIYDIIYKFPSIKYDEMQYMI